MRATWDPCRAWTQGVHGGQQGGCAFSETEVPDKQQQHTSRLSAWQRAASLRADIMCVRPQSSSAHTTGCLELRVYSGYSTGVPTKVEAKKNHIGLRERHFFPCTIYMWTQRKHISLKTVTKTSFLKQRRKPLREPDRKVCSPRSTTVTVLTALWWHFI